MEDLVKTRDISKVPAQEKREHLGFGDFWGTNEKDIIETHNAYETWSGMNYPHLSLSRIG